MTEYSFEKVDDILEEIEPLLEEHYQEVAMYQEHIAFNPNYDVYRVMEEMGSCLVYTARDGGALVGYVVTFLQNNPHYQDHIWAVNDIVYVCPEYRHTEVAPEMLQTLEAELKERGVSVMTFHMKTFKPFETLMGALGFDKAEYMYSKYIKDE